MFKEDVGVVSGVTVAEELLLDEDWSLLRNNFAKFFGFSLLRFGAVTIVGSGFWGTRSRVAAEPFE